MRSRKSGVSKIHHRYTIDTPLKLIKTIEVKGIAHITGGGIAGNLVRILPDRVRAVVELTSWQLPEIFNWLSQTGDISRKEMFKTFNCGIGLMLVVASNDADKAIELLNDAGEKAWQTGTIESSDSDQPFVELNG